MREQEVTVPMELFRHAPGECMEKRPRHLAIILQGHRAWARKKALSPEEAAEHGFQRLLALIDFCMHSRIKRVSFCAFSEDMLSPSQGEQPALLQALVRYLAVAEQNLPLQRARFCSDVRLPSEDAFIGKHLLNLSFKTRFNKGMLLNFVVDNPKLGCWNGPRKAHGSLESELDRATKTVPMDADSEPDFVIRTGGPMSVQNAMLWYTGRTTLYFTDVQWPEFDAQALKEALDWYGLDHREKGFQRYSTCDEVLRLA